MLHSLYGRLAIVLATILALLGGVFAFGAMVSGRAIFGEINQDLHRDLAAHLVKDSLPMVDGEVQAEALEHIFHMLMVVNPSIEVYLLDLEGRILAYDAPPEVVVRDAVDLAPIRDFLSGEGKLPIWGQDPRSPIRERVFSVAPIGSAAAPEGYLYVVLGGEQLDSAIRMVRSSRQLQIGLGMASALLLFGLLAGLVLFFWMTRRVRRLDRRMEAFRKSGFESAPPAIERNGSDEVDRLERTFEEMAHRLVDQLGELRKTDSLRRELVANVSHDLRTPLTSLQGYLETLRVMTDLPAEERRQYLETALRQTRRLARLVRELMDLARLDSATLEMRREPLVLNELVQDVVQQFQLGAGERDVQLEADLPEGLAIVDADVGLVSRVLENLIDNGLRHTPEGGLVSVILRRNDGDVGVDVCDTGCGIADEDLPRIFDRFYRNPRDRNGSGAGLGLAIAKRILELHDSTLTVESQVGGGSTFSFRLPVLDPPSA